MDDYKIIFANLPLETKGMAVKMFDDGEDRVTIVLNSRYTWEQNRLSAIHELDHIKFNDFDLEDCEVDTIEYVRHEAM